MDSQTKSLSVPRNTTSLAFFSLLAISAALFGFAAIERMKSVVESHLALSEGSPQCAVPEISGVREKGGEHLFITCSGFLE